MRFLIWRFNDFSSFQPKLIITLSVDLYSENDTSNVDHENMILFYEIRLIRIFLAN